jgi:ABC-type arginine transport system ATPase subunit
LRRDRFGFVFQFGQLVPELTAQENVALPLSLGGTSRSAAMGEAAMWFGGLGLDGLERRRSGELSGGATRPVAPGPKYYLIVALGLVAALAILGSTLPMLSRITGPEASRFD